MAWLSKNDGESCTRGARTLCSSLLPCPPILTCLLPRAQAYGLLNTLYYTCAFLFAWIYVAKVPHGQGVAAAAKAFAG